jgi:hypothetical protein
MNAQQLSHCLIAALYLTGTPILESHVIAKQYHRP